jgi:hypothetical protein
MDICNEAGGMPDNEAQTQQLAETVDRSTSRTPWRGHPRRIIDCADFLQASTAQRPAPIRHGRVRYDGVMYLLMPQHVEPIDSLGEICARSANWNSRSRYGTFGRPTWYGALDPATAIAEMCYHALVDRADAARDMTMAALYQLRVRGRFVDLHGRESSQPEIIGDDYRPTQALARQTRATTLGGILYPSARSSGTSLAVFDRSVFRSLRFVDMVPFLRAGPDTIKARPPWNGTWWSLHLGDLQRASPERVKRV